MMMDPEILKELKKCWNFNGEIVDIVDKDGNPICPICKTPLIKESEYTYKGNCKHFSRNVRIGMLK